MRTRLYNKMRAQEIEDYLNRGGETIILAVGVIDREFFEETKIHPCHINICTIMPKEEGHAKREQLIFFGLFQLGLAINLNN